MKNTTDKIILVPLISDGPNTGFRSVPNPDYVGLQRSSPPSYTLAELEQLAHQYADGSDASSDLQSSSDALKFRLYLGMFLIWLGKKEREANERDTKS